MNHQQLLKKIKDAQHLYYNEPDSVVMSDAEYDALVIMANAQGLSDAMVVGAKTAWTKNKIKHRSRMYSLDNVYSFEALQKWCERFALPLNTYVTVEPKLDGCSLSLIYQDGKLIEVATRGNGYEGEDVTHIVKPIIPHTVKASGIIQVRGELVVDNEAFEDLNTIRMAEGMPMYAHPRGAAAGILSTVLGLKKEPRIHYARFCAFDLRGIELASSQSVCLDVLRVMGFHVESIMEGVTVNTLLDRFQQIGKPSLTLPTDGVVIKADDHTLQTVLGHTAKAPKWAIAYKYPTAEACSKLISVDFQTGRSGKVTPVAIFDPVTINGSRVERATLNNASYIETLDLHIGDYIQVRKAAEIIPEIVKVHKDLRSTSLTPLTKIEFTKKCSSCGHRLKKEEEQADWFCVNTNCEAIIIAKICYFFSRTCLNVKSLGVATITACVQELSCFSPWDIYSLSRSEWLTLPLFGENKYLKIKQELNDSLKQPWFRLLTGFGIPGVGSRVARTVAANFTIYELMFVEKQGLLDLEGIGEEIADSIIYWFSIPSHREFLDWCVDQGFNTTPEPKTEVKSEALQGSNFVLSGTFFDEFGDKIERSEIQKLIVANGGGVLSNVSANTHYFLAGTSAGASKLLKVKELGIPVIDLNTLHFLIVMNE